LNSLTTDSAPITTGLVAANAKPAAESRAGLAENCSATSDLVRLNADVGGKPIANKYLIHYERLCREWRRIRRRTDTMRIPQFAEVIT
jgi:hypothetical protein